MDEEPSSPEAALEELKAQMRRVVAAVNGMLELLQAHPILPRSDEKRWLVWQLAAHEQSVVDVCLLLKL